MSLFKKVTKTFKWGQHTVTMETGEIARQATGAQMKQQALTALQQIQLTTEHIPPALVMFEEQWHQGVIGIVAGRLKEQFHRPTIVFAPDTDGEHIKGSARSIDGVHIRDTIEQVAEQYPHLVSHFGGHAAAAGLTLKKDNFIQIINNQNTSTNIRKKGGSKTDNGCYGELRSKESYNNSYYPTSILTFSNASLRLASFSSISFCTFLICVVYRSTFFLPSGVSLYLPSSRPWFWYHAIS